MATVAAQQQITLDHIRVTYLPDGYALFDPHAVFPTSSAQDWQHYQHLLNDNGLLVGSLGAHVIQTPDHTLLIDTSQGPRHIENSVMTLHGGELLTNLQRIGLAPADIDIVFYTHLHVDHVGWTGRIVNDQYVLTFTRARHLVRSAEWQRFDDPSTTRANVDQALKLLKPHIEFIEDGQAIVPGVVVKATPGHTAGHAALVISAGAQRAIIMGDAFHSTVQFEHPTWTNTFDSDTELAKVARQHLIDDLAQPATCAVGTHFADTVFGRLTPVQDKYIWQPAAS